MRRARQIDASMCRPSESAVERRGVGVGRFSVGAGSRHKARRCRACYTTRARPRAQPLPLPRGAAVLPAQRLWADVPPVRRAEARPFRRPHDGSPLGDFELNPGFEEVPEEVWASAGRRDDFATQGSPSGSEFARFAGSSQLCATKCELSGLSGVGMLIYRTTSGTCSASERVA